MRWVGQSVVGGVEWNGGSNMVQLRLRWINRVELDG